MLPLTVLPGSASGCPIRMCAPLPPPPRTFSPHLLPNSLNNASPHRGGEHDRSASVTTLSSRSTMILSSLRRYSTTSGSNSSSDILRHSAKTAGPAYYRGFVAQLERAVPNITEPKRRRPLTPTANRRTHIQLTFALDRELRQLGHLE